MTYLIKTAGGIPGVKCNASGKDTVATGLLLQKQARIMNSDKRPRPQLYLTTTPLPIPVQLKLSISQLPHLCNKPTNICSQVDRRSLRAPPALTKLMTLKRSCRHNGDFKLPFNLPRDKVAAHFKLYPYPHPQQSLRKKHGPFQVLYDRKRSPCIGAGKEGGPLPLYSETKENPKLQPCGVTFKATHLSQSPAEVSMGNSHMALSGLARKGWCLAQPYAGAL